MATKYILSVLAVMFLVLGAARFIRDGGVVKPAAKTWLLIGGIFAVVSVWLFFNQ